MKPYLIGLFVLCPLALAIFPSERPHHAPMYIDTTYTDSIYHSGDYVVGSGDSLSLHDTYFHLDGDLYISGSGMVKLDRSCISIFGDVNMSGNAEWRDTLSLIRFRSDYLYQFGFYMRGSSCYHGGGSTWHFENWIANMAVTETALYEGFNIDYFGGPTATLLGAGRINLKDCRYFVEIVVIQDSVTVQLKGCENILVWLGLPDGATGTLSPPGGMDYKFCDRFEITPTSGTIDNPGYSITVDSSYMFWGTIPSAGCSVTIEACTLRTTGLYMNEPRIYNLSGIYDSTFYDYFELGLPDRHLTLDDVYMITWNLYGENTAEINIDSCVFGECLAMGNCDINISNSTCDGTGGWVGATSDGNLTLDNVVVQTIAQTQGYGRLHLKESYILWNVQSTNNGTITAVDVEVSPYSEIIAHDEARLIWAKITSPPDSGAISAGDTIAGKLYALFGPDAELTRLDGWITYLPPDSFFWRAMGDTINSMPDGPLTIWDVAYRPVGMYDVRLNVQMEPDIEFRVERSFEYVSTSVKEADLPSELELHISPNPFNGACLIAYDNPPAQLSIFDINGRLVRKISLFEGAKSVIWNGRDDFGAKLSSGIYFIAPNSNMSRIKKVVMVR